MTGFLADPAREYIMNFYNKGELVLDCFAGAGQCYFKEAYRWA
jgi:tRNA G37 N-methylase Trm5